MSRRIQTTLWEFLTAALVAAMSAMIFCWPADAQQTATVGAGSLTFSPQGGRKVALWAVTGCAAKPVPVAQIYRIATAHGLTWLTPGVAGDVMAKRTAAGRLLRIGTYLAAGASVLLNLKVVQANDAISKGVATGDGFLGSILPLVSQAVAKPDSSAGADLAIASNGCGAMLFYAGPSKLAAFTEAVP